MPDGDQCCDRQQEIARWLVYHVSSIACLREIGRGKIKEFRLLGSAFAKLMGQIMCPGSGQIEMSPILFSQSLPAPCGKRTISTMSKSSVFHADPEILGGMVVFKGTRVPLQNLIDYLEGGYTLDQFVDDFPSVTKDQAIQGLEEARELLAQAAR